MVVECTGSTQGLELALRLVRPRGTLILKSTVADKSTLNLAPIVIDEIRVQGSRCGPFLKAIALLRSRKVDPTPLITRTFALNDAQTAIHFAQKTGAMKVLLKP